jgi:pyruvate,water dikinase
MAMTAEPLALRDEIKARASNLGETLVARSSTTLEASGEWSGAFTSYLDLTVDDLPRGVVGCWASAFSVATLERLERAGIEPGTFAMSVLVQPALHPLAGGIARVETDGTITVIGVKGSPAPLLQGLVTGHEARWSDRWDGEELMEIVGVAALTSIVGNMRLAAELLGATQCEWAMVDAEVWLLQLGAPPLREPLPALMVQAELRDPHLIHLARTVVRAPGPMGEAWVLPWALGGMPEPGPVASRPPKAAAREATELCAQLASDVWQLPPKLALEAAREHIKALRGPNPVSALARVRRLCPPDATVGGRLLSLVAMVRMGMVEAGAAADPDSAWYLMMGDVGSVLGGGTRQPAARVGIGQWEPFVAAVVLANGRQRQGTPASSGVGAGPASRIDDVNPPDTFRPRHVVAAPQPVPALASMLWDAAGLVTTSGSSAAHLFESARALGVPAVCGVTLSSGESEILGVDGYTGVVASIAARGADVE